MTPSCPQKSRHTESEKLQVQIQAYLDNVFDVGGLLEDAETKNVALEKVEELEEHLSHVCEHGGMWGCSLLGPGEISGDTRGVPELLSQPCPPPQLTEKLLDLENENMMRVAELEKQLLQREKELEVVKVCWGERCRGCREWGRVLTPPG